MLDPIPTQLLINNQCYNLVMQTKTKTKIKKYGWRYYQIKKLTRLQIWLAGGIINDHLIFKKHR